MTRARIQRREIKKLRMNPKTQHIVFVHGKGMAGSKVRRRCRRRNWKDTKQGGRKELINTGNGGKRQARR